MINTRVTKFLTYYLIFRNTQNLCKYETFLDILSKILKLKTIIFFALTITLQVHSYLYYKIYKKNLMRQLYDSAI